VIPAHVEGRKRDAHRGCDVIDHEGISLDRGVVGVKRAPTEVL
jgi:hypothetical protein